jgi:hypothetical protein
VAQLMDWSESFVRARSGGPPPLRPRHR